MEETEAIGRAYFVQALRILGSPRRLPLGRRLSRQAMDDPDPYQYRLRRCVGQRLRHWGAHALANV